MLHIHIIRSKKTQNMEEWLTIDNLIQSRVNVCNTPFTIFWWPAGQLSVWHHEAKCASTVHFVLYHTSIMPGTVALKKRMFSFRELGHIYFSAICPSPSSAQSVPYQVIKAHFSILTAVHKVMLFSVLVFSIITHDSKKDRMPRGARVMAPVSHSSII